MLFLEYWVDNIQKAHNLMSRDVAGQGQVVRPPQAAKCGTKLIYWMKTFYFMYSSGFRLSSQVQEIKYVIVILFYKVHNFCYGRPLWLLTPGTKKPSYATARVYCTIICTQRMNVCTWFERQLHYFGVQSPRHVYGLCVTWQQ